MQVDMATERHGFWSVLAQKLAQLMLYEQQGTPDFLNAYGRDSTPAPIAELQRVNTEDIDELPSSSSEIWISKLAGWPFLALMDTVAGPVVSLSTLSVDITSCC